MTNPASGEPFGAPLAGLVVADFSRVLAGPLATTYLADLGARVIKIERPEVGDDTRHWGPPWAGDAAAYFASANRSKESLALDLADPADRDVALALAVRADIVVENYRVGALDGKGLGYNDIAARNPGIVYCSISGFGSGVGADLGGYDFLVQAVGGLMSITGEPDGEPTKAGVALIDVLTAKDAVMGILAALRVRDQTGSGQHIEVNLLSSSLAGLVNQASNFFATGNSPQRMGNRHPSITPYETLHCGTGLLAVCCGNDSQFATLCDELGIAAIAVDPRFQTNSERVKHRDELVATLEAALSAAAAQHWAERLTARGLAAGLVGDIGSGFALAERLGLQPRVAVGPDDLDQVRHPVTYSHTPVAQYRRPPRLDEHGADIRAWLTTQPQHPHRPRGPGPASEEDTP